MPDLKHPAYDRVNLRVRSMLAEHTAAHSAKVGRMEKQIEMVCEANERTTLVLDFGGCYELPDLSDLTAVGKLQKLEQLTLKFNACSQLADISGLAVIGNLQRLA